MSKIESITVPLLVAGQIYPHGVVYTEACLRSAARLHRDYCYDETTKTLYYRTPEVTDDYPVTPVQVPRQTQAPLTPQQQWYLDTERRALENTNMGFQDVQIPYTKVWAFLHVLLQCTSLQATVILSALRLASTVSNDEVVRLADYDGTAAQAHDLMRLYFLNKA